MRRSKQPDCGTAKSPLALPPATKDPAKELAALKRNIRKLCKELDSDTLDATRDKLLALAKS